MLRRLGKDKFEIDLENLIPKSSELENISLVNDGTENSFNIYSYIVSTFQSIQNPKSNVGAVSSCIIYSLTSVMMVVVNKVISSSVTIEDANRLPKFGVVLYQSIVAVLLVSFAKYLRILDYSDFSIITAVSWLPVNIFFVGMICSGFMSLVYVSVPMVTIFKNLGNILAVSGEWYYFNEPISYLTMLSIFLMTVGAVMAGINDLEFNIMGYIWMSLNAVFSAGYALCMRHASKTIKLTKFGMVFYNNLLSIFLIAPIFFLFDDLLTLWDPNIMSASFMILNTLAGFMGFYLNFASLWCVGATSATTFSLVGSVNKIPILIIGFILFNAKISDQGILFIVFASIGAFLFVWSKLPKSA